MPDDLPPAVASRMLERFTAVRRQLDGTPSASVLTRFRIAQRIGGLTMRQRIGIALSGIGVLAVLGLLMLFGSIAAKPVSAMDQMAKNVREAVSFRAVMTAEGQSTPKPGEPPAKYSMTGDIYWLAPGSSRVDIKGNAPSVNGKQTLETSFTSIVIPGRPGETIQEIRLDHKAKAARKTELRGSGGSYPEMLRKLGDFSGKADRFLGDKEIDGHKTSGFEIGLKELTGHPDRDFSPGKHVAEVWIDSESNLPVLVTFKTTNDGSEQTLRFQDFKWNVELDPKLFDPTPPKDYTMSSPSLSPP
jgi:outer membrane lipoprotein-sorting protein